MGAELAEGAGRCVTPVFVQIDNGYQSDEIAPVGPTGQLLAPAIGLSRAAAGYEAAARSASRRLFDHWFTITTRAHPGSQAPLGWVLSSDAQDDLASQLDVNRDAIRAVRSLLDDPAGAPGAGTVCPSGALITDSPAAP
jgi:hypothetical protein